MATTVKIEVKDANPTAALQEFLRQVLERGGVQAVLAPCHLPSGGAVMPTLVAAPAQVSQADPLSPSFPMNAARLLARLTRGDSSGTLAAVLRPCEIRAFIELVKLNQGNMEQCLIIGLDCQGAYSNSAFRRLSQGRDPRELTRDFLSGKIAEPLMRSCQVCEQPTPPQESDAADIHVGLFGIDLDREIPVMSRSAKGEALLRRLEYPEMEVPVARRQALDSLLEERISARDRMFEATGEAIASLEKLGSFLSGCVNCYNCRVACPVCYCRECVFVTDVFDHKPWQYMGWARQKGMLRMPTDTIFYHLTRLTHMSTACVGCGQCSNACPNEIPVMELFRTVASRTQKAFDYLAGRSLQEPPPMSVFQEKEFSELTGGRD